MAKVSIAEMKAKLKAQEDQKKESSNGKGKLFGDIYPHWTIEVGEENGATVRVLPHAGMEDDALTPFIEKLTHTLSINGEDKKFPCLKMYGEKCPVCDLSQKFYKAEGKKSEKGQYYWHDKQFLASGYVNHDPLPADEETKENATGKQKVLQFGRQLHDKYDSRFKSMLTKDELNAMPWDVKEGLNFNIVKTKNAGDQAKYDSLSDFARKETALPQDFLANFTPVDLTKYLPANPGAAKVQRMLDAHLTGEEYVDDDKPSNNQTQDSTKEETKAEKSETKTESKAEKVTKPEVPAQEPVKEATQASDTDGQDDAEDNDFLAKLRARAAANKS
jgi:hypothetical protein